MENQRLNYTASQANLYYQLSLSIGNTLDIEQNAMQFANTLLEYDSIERVDIWLNNASVAVNNSLLAGYSLAYSTFTEGETEALGLDATELLLLSGTEAVLLRSEHPDFASLTKSADSVALYRLSGSGILKLHFSEALNSPDDIGLPQKLVDKFALSLQACLAHTKANENETRISKIIDSALDAVVLIDDKGYVTHWNQQASKMFGWTYEEAIGTDMAKLFIPHRHRSAHNTGMKHYHKTGEGPVLNKRIEITAINRSGHEFDVELTIIPIKLDNTTVFSGFLRDITEEKLAKKELIEARERAEASVRAREEFLANMSHEIRTPLNAMMGMGELLTYTQLDEKQNAYVDGIERSAKNLLVIVNDILDFSKIEAGKVSIEKIGFDLHHLVDVLYHSEKTKAFKKDIGFEFEYDNRIDPILISDPVRLNQILLNLINNALKFTRRGKIVLKTELLYKTPSLNAIRFIVEDTGIGIEPEKLDSIFDEFTQADASITRRFGGTGLGLTISRKLVELLEGHISVESKQGEGTTFSVIMSMNIGTSADLPNIELADGIVEKVKGKHILLVEDHDLNQMLATGILEEFGMTVDLAENGKIAVEKIQENTYDLVLMDMQMPVMDGLEATRIIRQELEDYTPIIALTANATQDHRRRCLEAGMNDYVAKPFESALLIGKIHNLLFGETPIFVVKDPLDQAEELLAEQLPVKEVYDLSFLERETKGNKAMMHRMLRLFTGGTLPILEDMEAAIKVQDWDKVRGYAHKLKTSMHMVGASGLNDISKKIEKDSAARAELEEIPALYQSLKIRTVILIDELKTLY